MKLTIAARRLFFSGILILLVMLGGLIAATAFPALRGVESAFYQFFGLTAATLIIVAMILLCIDIIIG